MQKYSRAWETLHRMGEVDSHEALQATMSLALADFGIDHFNIVALAQPGQAVSPSIQLSNEHRAWQDHYIAEGHARRDPFVPWTFQTAATATWDSMEQRATGKEQRRLFDEQRSYMRGNGIVVPIHGALGAVSCVVMSGPAPDFSPEARPILRMLAIYMAEVARELVEARDDSVILDNPLSARQVEALKWIGEGKSDWEIGQILGIAEATAHRHVERAKRALGVNTRIQAFTLAWRHGWLTRR